MREPKPGPDPATRAPIPSFYDDLDATLLEAWRLLARAVADRRAAMHTPAIATIGLDGWPKLRCVVLRALDARARLLRVHTDARSPKVAEILADPRVGLLAYDAGAKIQLRLEGGARVETEGEVVEQAWRGARPQSRLCYRVGLAPGSGLADPRDLPIGVDDAAGRMAFAVITMRIDALEFLYLASEGHRRARFVWNGEGKREAFWLVP